MPPRIIVTTDGSPGSRQPLLHAAALSNAAGGELILLQVLNPQIDLANERDTDLAAAAERVRLSWAAELAAVLARAGVEGRGEVAIQERREDTKDAIVRVAAEHEAALVAMHSRGAGSALRQAALGSVAMGVVGDSGMGVLLTGPVVQPPSTTVPYRILVALGEDAETVSLIESLARLYSPGAAIELTFLVVAGGEQGEEHRAQMAERLQLLRPLLPQGIEFEVRFLQEGSAVAPRDSILKAARDAGAGAIAITTHAQGALRRLVAGSLALDVLANSPVPVILSAGK